MLSFFAFPKKIYCIPTKHSKQNALLGSFAALFFLASLDTSRYFRCSISLWLTELATVPLTGGLPDLLPREKTNMNMQRQMCCIYKQAYRHIWSQTEFIYCGHGWHQMMSVWMFVWVGRGGGDTRLILWDELSFSMSNMSDVRPLLYSQQRLG